MSHNIHTNVLSIHKDREQHVIWIGNRAHIPCDPLQWRHNERNGFSNHQPHNCLINRLFRHRSKKTSKLRVTGLCAGNSPVTGEFPAQMASNVENVSIWWRHHATVEPYTYMSRWSNFKKLSLQLACSHMRSIACMWFSCISEHRWGGVFSASLINMGLFCNTV